MKLVVAVLIASCSIMVACADDLESISQISKFRVLAVQTSPPEVGPGDSSTVRVLTADPEEKGAEVLWMPVAGSWNDPDEPIGSNAQFNWFPDITEIVDGIASYDLPVTVPADYLDDLPGDLCSDQASLGDPAQQQENWREDPACRKDITVLALACAGGAINNSLAGAIDDLKSAAEKLALGEITDEEFMQIAQKAMDTAKELLVSVTALKDIETLCEGADADSVLALKTIKVSFSEHKNSNPEISKLQINIDGTPETLPTLEDGGPSPLLNCDKDADGCRDPAEVTAYLTEGSFLQYLKKEYDEYYLTDVRNYVSWFSDGGEFDSDRSGNNGEKNDPFSVNWTPPREGGSFTLWAVAHNIRGGISWQRYKLVAVAP